MPGQNPYLTISRYMDGLTCSKMIWLGWNEPAPDVLTQISIPQITGTEIGLAARKLFPGGKEIEATPWEHQTAVFETRKAIADNNVNAIFEAAFEFDDIRIRVDVLERIGATSWAICEVKSSSFLKSEHMVDAALQHFVLSSLEVNVSEVSIIHVNKNFIRKDIGIDWDDFFIREDITDLVVTHSTETEAHVVHQKNILARGKAPEIEPGKHCPRNCLFWERCISHKPDDWIHHLPRLSKQKFSELQSTGIEAITDIPDEFPLNQIQLRIKNVLIDEQPYISSNLSCALKPLSRSCYYLDFEATNPSIPLFTGNRPYEQLPFQWSLHRAEEDGELNHMEFLATGESDPSREFAESLIDALGNSELPIAVYSKFENWIIEKLAKQFSDLHAPLRSISSRLVDVLHIIRNNIYLEDFDYSYSIKSVGPALVPGFSYGDIGEIKDGLVTAEAFQMLASQFPGTSGTSAKIRKDLLDYCRHDTLAMVRIHDALLILIPSD